MKFVGSVNNARIHGCAENWLKGQ